MKKGIVTKSVTALGLACLLSFMLAGAAHAWNQATHAYIAERLAGPEKLKEMWGSTAPDFFNYIFDPKACPGWVSDQTHGTTGETFLKLWNAASKPSEKALAYGFVSHNQQWGDDYVAHISGLRPGYESGGYIIVKARQLLDAPVDRANLHPTFGEVFTGSFGASPEEALLIAHVIAEYAIDIRLAQEADPLLGRKLAAAARSEAKRFTPLLVKAYAADYAADCFNGDLATATTELSAAVQSHRKDMIYLGQALSRPEPVAVALLAEQLVAILGDFLPGPPPENALAIIKASISSAMNLCDDYRAEIETTIEFVGKNLEAHGIIDPAQGDARNGLQTGAAR
jgi:hypothetical protein